MLRDYADQREQATEARTRLLALRDPSASTNGSGMVARRLWTGPNVDTLGTVSADGRYLSFVDWSTGDLAIRDLRSGENRKLTHRGYPEFVIFSRFSPDGKQIAYNLLTKQNFGWDLRIIGKEDGADRAVLSTDNNDEWVDPAAWSPDGKLLLARLVGSDRTWKLALISVADGSKRVLKTFDWRRPDHASFSPDSRYIVYDFPPKEDSLQRDIYVLATDGSRESRIIEHPADDYTLGWTPDGQRILFASDRAGAIDAWAIAVADGKPQGAPELVKKSLGWISPLGFTRSGAFYYGVAVGTKDIYTVAFDPQAGKVVGEPARGSQRFMGTNVSPDWSRDGSLVYLSRRGERGSNGPGPQFLCITSMGTLEQRELPLRPGYFQGPRWSPDGKSILLAGRDEKGRPSLFLVDAQTGALKTLIREDGVVKGVWSPDGKTVYWLRDGHLDPVRKSGQLMQILVRDLDTGADRELFRKGASTPVGDGLVNSPAVSPNGQTLAFIVREGEARLMLVPTSGGAAREIFRGKDLNGFDGLAWTADGRQILMVKNVGRLCRVLRSPGRPGFSPVPRVPVEGVRHALPDRQEVCSRRPEEGIFWPCQSHHFPDRSPSC
ncbi:MAG: PD40 domain-containing protein [Acidobacteria bacterium]|nr:PD40 domain-containing protein [Acidobacteriota bacterium]